MSKIKSDGSTASYYELPKGATELQHLISSKNMNAQIGEIFRACYRYGQVEHSPELRDAKKIKFYIEAEIERLEKYNDETIKIQQNKTDSHQSTPHQSQPQVYCRRCDGYFGASHNCENIQGERLRP